MNDTGVSDACVFVALALFVVWMQRQKVTTLASNPTRWGAFFGALSGKYTITSTTSTASSSSSSGGSSSTPSTTTPTYPTITP